MSSLWTELQHSGHIGGMQQIPVVVFFCFLTQRCQSNRIVCVGGVVEQEKWGFLPPSKFDDFLLSFQTHLWVSSLHNIC